MLSHFWWVYPWIVGKIELWAYEIINAQPEHLRNIPTLWCVSTAGKTVGIFHCFLYRFLKIFSKSYKENNEKKHCLFRRGNTPLTFESKRLKFNANLKFSKLILKTVKRLMPNDRRMRGWHHTTVYHRLIFVVALYKTCYRQQWHLLQYYTAVPLITIGSLLSHHSNGFTYPW